MKRDVSTILVLLITVLLGSAASAQVQPKIIKYSEMCDASAAVPVGPTLFVVANDEDNQLRVYRRDRPSGPIFSSDLTAFLKPDPKHPEADIEGATRLGDLIYWITSHGTNEEHKPRPTGTGSLPRR